MGNYGEQINGRCGTQCAALFNELTKPVVPIGKGSVKVVDLPHSFKTTPKMAKNPF